MPRGWKSVAKAQRQSAVRAKALTGFERAKLFRLADALQDLRLEEGYIRADVRNSSAVRDFLKLVDECASTLNAQMASRAYREFFTANYRSLLPSHERLYLAEVMIASISQASEGFLCVNGDMHPLPIECQSKAATFRSALMVLATKLKSLADAAHVTEQAQVKRHEICDSLRVFDEAWAAFEREYINTLIRIEAKSRAPLVEAINLEKLIGTPFELQHTSLERFLDCVSNLIAKVQLRHRRTDDKLDLDVLISAKKIAALHDPRIEHEQPRRRPRNWVSSILAHGVVNSFDDLRRYLQTIEKKIEQAHPDLHLNPGLVEKLNAVRQSWKLYEEWGKEGPQNKALNSVIAVVRRAMRTRPSFRKMCEECDPELFLVLPRIVLLCFLEEPTALQAVVRKFLPDKLCGAEDANTKQPSGLVQVLNVTFCSTVLMLRGAHLKSLSMEVAARNDCIFDLLIQRAILGNTYDKNTLYEDIDVASHGAAASKVDSFMRDLEGYSLELQRHSPEAWNTFTELFVACVADELPTVDPQEFRV